MKKPIILICSVLVLSGCSLFSKELEDRTDVENSPCACVYFGEQLATPTAEDLRLIESDLSKYSRS